ncbi:MAG: argininosuccinate lyase, partial [Candidatus Bathyarchaeia archaeon]
MSEGIYRARLSKSLTKEALLFISSLKEDEEILIEDIIGTEAHNIMLYEQGIINRDELKKILKALEEIKKEFINGKIQIQEGYEDIHEFLESKVIEKTNIEVGGKLHTARSRNDQVALDIRMKLRFLINEASSNLLNLIEALINLALKEFDTPIILYTHTQQAQVGLFSHYLMAYAEAFFRDLERLNECYKRVNLNPLGACAIAGTRFPINRFRVAELLGFDGIIENSIDASSFRDFEVETIGVLSILMLNIARICEDLILWSTTEFNFIELADEYASSSSIMPQKKNPCILELIRGKTGEVSGALTSLLTILKGLPSGYNRDLQETKKFLWRSFKTVNSSIKILTSVIETLTLNKAKIEKIINEEYLMATDLAEELTLKKGLSFREAHKLVGELIKKMIYENKKLRDISPFLIEELSKQVLGKAIRLTQEELNNIFNFKKAILERRSTGSSSPKEVEKEILNMQRKI